MKIFKTTEYNIDASGIVDVTKELQHLIDLTAEENGMLILEKGILPYLFAFSEKQYGISF